jgi:hypothetical protein
LEAGQTSLEAPADMQAHAQMRTQTQTHARARATEGKTAAKPTTHATPNQGTQASLFGN